MRATTLRGPGRVELVDAPWPEVRDPRDAVVRVTRAAICGTDLHPYRGEIPGFRPDTIMGHEFVGVVDEAGPQSGLSPGARVVGSDVIACGRCWWCRHGGHYQCEQVSLFGYGEVVGQYVPGGQADAVRVPFADTVLVPVPDGVDDDDALFVGDVLTTGWTAAAEGGVAGGDVVAVVGCGPVGLCAALSARLCGAADVIGVDRLDARRQMAASMGLVAVGPDDARQAVGDLTAGRGADVVIEAVGTPAALTAALALVRPRGTVTAVGAHHEPAFPLDTGDAFGRELTLRFAVGDPVRWGPVLFDHLVARRLQPARLVSHRVPLDEVAAAYALFDQGDATKVLLVPSERGSP
jgi:threonine dehydrogenase-like Zn-dependent dehydrogenase